MLAAGYGRIVKVASIAGKEGIPGIAAYAPSKQAVIGFTKSLARELTDTGVLVNCIAPVMTETDLLAEMTEEHITATKAKIPMGRLLRVEEIAAMVAWIASPECSFTTGSCSTCPAVARTIERAGAPRALTVTPTARAAARSRRRLRPHAAPPREGFGRLLDQHAHAVGQLLRAAFAARRRNGVRPLP